MSDALDLAPEGDEIDTLSADLAAAFAAASTDTEVESTAPETPAAEPETAPVEKTAAERARDEKGRFATTPAEKAASEAPKAPADAPKPEGTAESAPQPEGPSLAPPPGWSPTAKAEFANLPPAVKDAVAKRETEINAGLAELKNYRDLKPFAEYARQRNSTLPQYIGYLANAEKRLESNPTNFVTSLMRDYRVHPAAIAQGLGLTPQYLMQLAQHMAGQGGHPEFQAPQQGQQQQRMPAPQPQPQAQPPRDPRVDQLWNRLQEMETAPMKREVESFLTDPKYPFAMNVKEDMALLLNNGKAANLSDAYDMAVWANPETRNLLIKQQREAEGRATAERAKAAASNARAAAKSVTGSPIAGASSTPDYPDDPVEAVRAAWNAQMGRI